MKFVVTCLEDSGKRVLASKSKVFTSIPDAVKYSNTVADIRRPSIVPVATDAEHAAEFIFEYIVEKHPKLMEHHVFDRIRNELRYELAGDGIMVVFAPGNDIASAFMAEQLEKFDNEMKRLMLEA